MMQANKDLSRVSFVMNTNSEPKVSDNFDAIEETYPTFKAKSAFG